MFFNDEPIGVELPLFVELMITETEPGVKGDTASKVTKPATLETGAVIPVPIFLNAGDRIKVDTRSGTYVERAKQDTK
jgi:elongation factor P